MTAGWDDLDLQPAGDARFTTSISDTWMLAVVPQGGVVAAIAARAMERVLGQPEQRLRTMTAMFAGQVAGGPVEVDVQVLRRGRSMSQLAATVRNAGAEAGLTAIAAFGATRPGFDFTELTFPDVPGPEGVRGFRDPLPEGVELEWDRGPMPFWEEVIESRPVIGRAPWEPFEDGPAEAAFWYRLDHPPLAADGSLDPVGPIVLCDTMPSSVGQKLGPESTTRSTCSVPPSPGGSSPTTGPATPATATPASTSPSGTRRPPPAPPSSPTAPRSCCSASPGSAKRACDDG